MSDFKKFDPALGAFLRSSVQFTLWRASRSRHDAAQGLAAELIQKGLFGITCSYVGSTSHQLPRRHAEYEIDHREGSRHLSRGRDERDISIRRFLFGLASLRLNRTLLRALPKESAMTLNVMSEYD